MGNKSELTVHAIYKLREYAKSRTSLRSADLTAEEAAWKFVYYSLTDTLRQNAPEMMTQVEPLEATVQTDQDLADAIEAKLKACPNDYGFKVPCGFLMVGGLIGWIRSGVWSVVPYGIVFCIAGLLFSIFAMDSAIVQATVAIRLHRLRFKGIAHWLY